MKAFWDSTGQLWASRALDGKYCGMFCSTASQHGGQETSILTFIPVLAHHGINFVPVGYASNLYGEVGEVMGGGPWGSATLSASDGSRLPSEKEKEAAVAQGVYFAKVINKVK
jgi:NAD(P)H dehydrogenase (quinone)